MLRYSLNGMVGQRRNGSDYPYLAGHASLDCVSSLDLEPK
jgi:hypothetical protein